MAPGDSVSFKRGGSWQGTLTINSSGNTSSPITIQAYGTGPNPTIYNVRANNSRTVVLNGSYIVLSGFTLHDAQEAGVEVAGSYNTVRDSEMYATGWGVRLLGQNNKVINNNIHDLLMVVNDAAPNNDYGAAGVVIWGGANGSEIAYNRFVRCRAPSQDYGTDGGVVEFWETSQDHKIHHNYTNDNNGAFEVGGGTVSNVSVYDNVFFNDYGGNAGFHWGGTFAAAVSNFKIENNTIVQQRQGDSIFSYWEGTAPDSSRVIVRNNVIATQQTVYNDSRFTHTNNTYYLMSGGSLGAGVSLGAGEKLADPMFVDLSGGNFHLQAGSPAIDAGLNLGHTPDFDGIPVPHGLAPDAGAYEYTGDPAVTPTATATATGNSV